MSQTDRRSLALAVLAGLWGGALAGLVDAALTSLRLADQISYLRHMQLAGLGAALGAWMGVGLALAAWVVARLAEALSRRWHRPRWAPAIWPVVLGSPLVFNAAFSVFAGPKASRIPGRFWLSCLLMTLGCVGLAVAGVAVASAVQRRSLARPEDRALPGLLWPSLILLAVVGWANAELLPRLYPWFHHTLAFAAVALGTVAARLVLRAPRRWAALVVASALVWAVPSAVAYASLRQSRQVRFALFDKTAALGVYASYLPLPKAKPRPRPVVAAGEDAPPTAPMPEGPKRPEADVVLITVDALRHDHVGAYGYQRPTTPNLDRVASEGVRFERAYTQAPHTSFAVTSMLTGKYYPTLLRLKHGDEGEPLTLLLRRYGWKTAAFYPPAVFFVDGDKLAGFRDSHYHFEYVKCEFLNADARVDQITTYFDQVKPERAFVWVHFFEPHEPYETHAGFHFGNRDKDRYDSEVAYTDAAVGKLLEYLAKHRPNSIVVVSADHGEEFDEHGGRYHGSSLYDEQVRVPLVLRAPNLAPRVVQGQAQLVDVAPTVLALLDIPVPARMRGTDLGPWLAGAAGAQLPPAFAEVESKRMVVHGDDKLICDSEAGACELFDLAHDPHETTNLIDDAPDRAERLRLRMQRWLDAQGKLESLGAENESVHLPKAIERGRLGDAGAAAELLRLVEVPGPTSLRQEAARLLALLPPQADLAAQLQQAVDRTQDQPAPVSQWLSVAATAAGADVSATVLSALQAGPASPTEGANAADAGAPEAPLPELPLMAALVLAEQGRAEGQALLVASLSHCNGTPLCRRVIRALAALRDVAVVPALHALMDDVNARLEVVRALGQLRSPTSLVVLTKALREDVRVPVRAEAALALAQLGGPRARAALTQAARREKEAAVQDAIKQALAPPARL